MFAADGAFDAVMSAQLTFNTVPAPGAVALLGAWGAAASRRRR